MVGTRPAEADAPKETFNPEEEKTIDEKQGTGAIATAGSDVTVHYTGWLYDEKAKDHHGEVFDSSVSRGEPFTFLLGAGQVIRGWDDGVAGMKVGGKRTLLIPAAFGYGRGGAGSAPLLQHGVAKDGPSGPRPPAAKALGQGA